MRLSDLVEESAGAALLLQSGDGSFPPGNNGPHRDPETPVRNTAHWLITLLRADEISGQGRFLDAAARAAAYLTTAAVRPGGATFFCRSNPQKDACNGLIGQAWVIEALCAAAERLREPGYRALAEEVFELHPFDETVGLWRVVDVAGTPGPIDITFNHQLWFAAAGALLDSSPAGPIGRLVHRLLDESDRSHLRVARSGRIIHQIASNGREGDGLPPRTAVVRQALARARRREIGYHAFNLHAFALLRERIPTHPLWASRRFRAVLHFVNLDSYVRGLAGNEYGYPYNPVGFEVAFALQTFGSCYESVPRSSTWWVERQLELTYDRARKLMNRATSDGATLAARLYEATRLRDMSVRLP